MLNALTEAFFRVTTASGGSERLSLPEIYAALAGDRIVRFPALRCHQAPAWHAFLVQVAVLGCEANDLAELPGDEPEVWRSVLRALTPDHAKDEPWCLVGPAAAPALLQSPVPGGDLAGFKSEIGAPDELDLLVTSKNHDLKAARMVAAEPDDWFFALLSLQTQEGFLGAGNYGIARMNGGFGSRPYMRLARAGSGTGGEVMRDLRILLGQSKVMARQARDNLLMTADAMALTWLEPWDGVTPITLDRLHPLFVEVCRRVRLVQRDGRIIALATQSKAARIDAKSVNGVLGDPWAPVETSADPPKVFSITQGGFSYRKLTELLFGSDKRSYARPLLAKAYGSECGQALVLHVAALARGQGKTEGFHVRAIPVSEGASPWINDPASILGNRAKARVRTAGDISGKALRPALVVLVQKGAAEPSWNKPSNDPLVGPALRRFDQRIDEIFFERLCAAVDIDISDDAASRLWAEELVEIAREILAEAAETAPRGSERRIIAVARARNLLEGALRKLLPDLYPPREAADDAA
jgi:CRISPR system Cascade subunit CasA